MLLHKQTVLCTYLLGQSAGLLGRVEDFVVEDGEVEGQAQPDRVRWLHVLLADVEGLLVGLLRVLHRVFTKQITTSHYMLDPEHLSQLLKSTNLVQRGLPFNGDPVYCDLQGVLTADSSNQPHC